MNKELMYELEGKQTYHGLGGQVVRWVEDAGTSQG